ncbi:alpha/beta fold hydrolase [Chryseobacterium tongliaoense]|uniref:alpha/beta fold hydrolase n=1 Tax=Chryseobacterium tongliaoense TaxID=3240933 RepID=UPI00351381B4
MRSIRKIFMTGVLCLTLFTTLTISCRERSETSAQETFTANHQTAKTRFIDVKGTSFAYRILGREKGIPLVLIQGLGWGMDNWHPAVTNGLARKYKLIIFDNRGVGASKGSTPNTIHAMADDAIDFIEALHLSKVNIMGYSMGGFIAQRMALSRPTLINKMILIGTGPQGAEGLSDLPNIIGGLKGLEPEEFFLKFGFTQSAASIANGKASYARIQLRTIDRDPLLSDTSSSSQFTAVLNWAKPDANGLSELNKIKNPVLIVHGENDLPIPVQNAHNMKQNLDHAELLIFPDSGHSAFFQNHDEFVAKAVTFLSE